VVEIFCDAGVIAVPASRLCYPQRLSITFVQLVVTIPAVPVVALFFPVVMNF
jgi:hypothetical protein